MPLNPQTVARILRDIGLTQLCSKLTDDMLWKLGASCSNRDTAAVLALLGDPHEAEIVYRCTQTEEGWAQIAEAVDLELHHRAHPDGGDEWIN
jgi:hypothetical protein